MSFNRVMWFSHAALLVLCLPTEALAKTPPPAFIEKGSEWKYLDNGSNQGTEWKTPGFNDKDWKSGRAKLGYSDQASTTIGFGPDPKNKFITSYFRKEFTVTDPLGSPALTLNLLRDDGAVVYLNGKEVMRSNVPDGPVIHTTHAKVAVTGPAEGLFFSNRINSSGLVEGRNVMAVEIHQINGASSDLGFDLELIPAPDETGKLTRGPYLQQAAPTSMVVRWRSNNSTVGVVRFGEAPHLLKREARESTAMTEHQVTLADLTPGTVYYYSIGTPAETLAGGDGGISFTTPPPGGTPKPTRIWVLGDAGTQNINQARVRNAFYSYTGRHIPDLCLLLGDNAYDRGTDMEYQKALFEMYPGMLSRVPFWSCLGNHETAQSVSFVDTYPYFDIFTFPTKGECGGVVSGSEHYYSFDYANIHFISLDSMTANRASSGAMATWLTQDLSSTTATWIIAFFHHPPYSKGSHNSDTDRQMSEMRRIFLPILEDAGVDLVLSGHSHSYERSFLLDGHYGMSTTLTDLMKKNAGDGRPDGNGAYLKHLIGPKAHLGTVYNVTGSAGQISGGRLNHPAMFFSANELGSVILDISGNRLDSTFLKEDGTTRDTYTIIKK